MTPFVVPSDNDIEFLNITIVNGNINTHLLRGEDLNFTTSGDIPPKHSLFIHNVMEFYQISKYFLSLYKISPTIELASEWFQEKSWYID